MRSNALLSVLLVLAVSLSSGAAVAQSDAYAGTNVSFEAKSTAIVDYAVDGRTMVESLQVQSTSEAEGGGSIDVGAGLSGVTSLSGSAVSVDSRNEMRATMTTESGAEIAAHDNRRGVLVLRTGDESQYVTANVSSSGSAEAADDARVVVTSGDGTKGTFIVVGDGEVTVNEEGNVAAELGPESKLVFRTYTAGRTEGDAAQEQLIADGTAAAEVYVQGGAESSGELTADVVTYSEDTTVEVTETSEGTVRMTASRSAEEGTVILTTVSEQAFSATDDLQVTVDGEAAARASSYSELESATNGGENSKYMLRQRSSARASADVLVGVNHFSEREVTMSAQESEGSSGGDADVGSGDGGGDGGAESSSSGQPGFGIAVAVSALVAAALFARARDG